METLSFREKIEKEMIAKSTEIVPAGQEWRVKELFKCEITVKAGAKLIVTENASKNKITVEEGGELEILGLNFDNEIIRTENTFKDVPDVPPLAPKPLGPEQAKLKYETALKNTWFDITEATLADREYVNQVLTIDGEKSIDEDEKVRFTKYLETGNIEDFLSDKMKELVTRKPATPLTGEEMAELAHTLKTYGLLRKMR